MLGSSSPLFNARGVTIRFWVVALLFAIGCSGDGFTGASGNDPGDTSAIAAKAGLDAPPIAVGPFLDGVFPPRTPNSPGSSTWAVTQAFANLNLGDALVISPNPNPTNDRLYVGTRDGLVRMFDNDPNVTSYEIFGDFTDRAWAVWDGGFLGLIFHPEFGQAGSPFRNYFYVFYTSNCLTMPDGEGGYTTNTSACDPGVPKNSTSGFFGAYIRLSRFEVPDGSDFADMSSEKVMIDFRLYNGSHRSGGMVFRNDGYLYVTIGDQFRYETAQDIWGNLEGGSVRLAVDVTDDGQGGWICPPGSHQPRRTYSTALGHSSEEFSGEWYCIPDDNVWQDETGGTFEEYCSVGHRNPHRLTWDPVTDRMWSGEVGQSTREEINVIECGNNYGWPFREGLVAGVRPEPSSYEGILTDPVIDFVRTEARAIIGGYVYRGTRYPELYGRYLTGDYVLGNIWALTLDEGTMTATKEYLTEFTPGGLGTFGQDKNGEVYLGDVIGGGPLWELERIGQAVPDPPQYLSQLGAFDDLTDLTPSSVWVPYTLNQPFWSDNALKTRFAAVPNDGVRDTAAEQIGFTESGYWTYPIGTVLMKHFDLGLDENDPSITTRLETRFMVLGDDLLWYALTYEWLADQTDAVLLTTDATTDYTIQLAGGGTRIQTWQFPSRLECMDCHRQESGGALGPRTHQFNGDYFYESTGRTDNQLATWNELDMFTPALDPAAIPGMPKSRAAGDVTASLEDRARSWLDSNCSSCHQPGTGIAGFDTRYWTPLEAQGLVWGPVRHDLGIPGLAIITPGDPQTSSGYLRMEAVGGIAMPPLAKSMAEQEGVNLMAEWILRIDPGIAQNGLYYDYFEDTTIDSLADLDALTPVRSSTASAFDISLRDRDNDFGFRFTGWIRIDTAGSYTFYTNSDDGSQLFIDGGLVVDNGGLHPPQEVSGAITLSTGYHEIEVTMFERGGGQVLDVSWQGPDTSGIKQAISSSRLFLTIPTPTTNDPPVLSNPGDQMDTLGNAVVLDLSVSNPDGDLLYFQSTGLPAGLSIDSLTGQITGVPTLTGPTPVTVGVSDGPEVSWVAFNWTITPPSGPFCGDGVVNGTEECDDGNGVAGDGCAPDCTLEYCGDLVLTPPETCEPPNTDLCNAICMTRAPLCGDGFLTPPEQCEDGNTIDGDGCSATCTTEITDLTSVGTIIASVPFPLGGGNHDLEVIRDGDKPPLGTTDDSRQYDSWDAIDPATEDWIGYSFAMEHTFNRVVFQEGNEFINGGWFDSITVQVLQGGVWTDVSNLVVTPIYAGEDGETYETYDMTFTPTLGDGIRIYGDPGGYSNFISVAELEVFSQPTPVTCGNGALDPGEECDDGNQTNGDGCTATCFDEYCGDNVVNDGGAETCDPPGTDICDDTCNNRTAVCGDGWVTPPENCEDGNTVSGDGCSSICQDESQDLTAVGTIIASIPLPQGGGNHDLEVIRDGDKPPLGTTDDSRQYDSWDGIDPATEDWIGYSFASVYTFNRVVFQEGNEFINGGWFDSLTVQVLQGGVWTEVSNLVITPSYGGADGQTYETHDMTFTPMLGDGIRIHGDPGGSSNFISVAELEVFAETTPITCGDGTLDPDEECDDGNNANGDGCAADCTLEPVCGDGTVTAPEECDDGNTVGGDGCASDCTFEPFCGDGILTAPEECDDGNTVDGDGCAADCTREPNCGDGFVTAPETCEPPGTDICNDTCTVRTPVCGDGWVTPPETCEDGNTVGGDGCSAVCQDETEDVTAIGTIVASIPLPQGGGNHDLEVIRDGDKPPLGTLDDSRQYDSWDGIDPATEDWIGYSLPSPRTFNRAAFQEGNEFINGGWFDLLTVQVRQGGVWTEVSNLVITPSYTGEGGQTYETFDMTFTPTLGDGIRIYGDPGGSSNFISVAELEVFAQPTSINCGDGTLDPEEECDDGNNVDGDGCTATCFDEYCGDGVVNDGGAEDCELPSTDTCTATCTNRTPLCGDGYITPPETCEDGNTVSGDGCSSICVDENQDITSLGTIVASIPAPLGGGNPDLEVIRDGDKPPVGNTTSFRQYDSWDAIDPATEDWIGYTFASDHTFSRVDFQEGIHFINGGWFDLLTVQVRQSGVWTEVSNLVITPSYPGDNGLSYETFEMSFTPMFGDGIRIYGDPGGSSNFISVGELEVFELAP
jgi:uncharacterized repeat protein (TIGR03806 family)